MFIVFRQLQQQQEEEDERAAALAAEQNVLEQRLLKKRAKKERRQLLEKLETQLFEMAVVNDLWDQSQQECLERGLLHFPSSLDKVERWSKISEMVPGKSKQQCLARYKFLKAWVSQEASQPSC